MTAEPARRLFVAVDVPQRVRAHVDAAAVPLRDLVGDARWTQPTTWHLTLAFLGWTDPASVPAVERACAAAAAQAAPFDVALDGGAGTFRGTVLWVGIEPCEQLDSLAALVRQALATEGFAAQERPFRAHLTLGRARPGGRLPAEAVEAYHGPRAGWTVRDVRLKRSRLGRGGARYDIEGRWPLGR